MRERSAAARAQWLAELVAALDAAKLVVERLPPTGSEHAELLARIAAARSNARAMQLRQRDRLERQFGPDWTGFR